MKKIFILILLYVVFASCAKNKSSFKIDTNYWKIPPDITKVVYEGGDGSSVENAIIIRNLTTTRDGIAAVYAYIEKQLGTRNKDWKLVMQSKATINERHYDFVTVEKISDDTQITYTFDITDFFGKF